MGRLENVDGKVYEGYFENDNLEGFGRYISLNSKKYYEGFFKESQAFGLGKMVFFNGKIQDGQWEEGKLIKENEKLPVPEVVKEEPEVP